MCDLQVFSECVRKIRLTSGASELINEAFRKPWTFDDKAWKHVIDVLVEASMNDMKQGRAAAKTCNYIVQAEAAYCNSSGFRSILLKQLQVEYEKQMQVNHAKEKSWINFANFLCAVFDLLRLNNMPLVALVSPVFEVLSVLAQPTFAHSEAAIQCLVMQLQFVGEELDRLNNNKMKDLVVMLRKLFLNEKTSQFSRLMLLEIIELRSGGWKLSPSAYQYYYEGTGN